MQRRIGLAAVFVLLVVSCGSSDNGAPGRRPVTGASDGGGPGEDAAVSPASLDSGGMSVDAADSGAADSRPQSEGGSDKGGTLVTLASGQSGPEAIAVDSASVYWVNQGTPGSLYNDGTVMKVSLAGGTVTTLASVQDGPWGIAIDPLNVYWTNTAAGSGPPTAVMSVSLTGGTPLTLASGQLDTEGIVALGSSLYWLSYSGVIQCSVGGGTSKTVAQIAMPDLANFGYIAADGENLYFFDGADNLERVPLSGGATTTLASADGTTYGIAVDARNVYWAVGGTAAANYRDGAIMSVPLAGGTPMPLATGQSIPLGVATDGMNVYWVDSLDGTVRKVAVKGSDHDARRVGDNARVHRSGCHERLLDGFRRRHRDEIHTEVRATRRPAEENTAAIGRHSGYVLGKHEPVNVGGVVLATSLLRRTIAQESLPNTT
jgi:hypothetical protein